MTSQVQQRNFYRILGVSTNATQTEIDQGYRRLIRRFDDPALRRTVDNPVILKKRIALAQKAYDTLSNREKREAYDRRALQAMNAFSNPAPSVSRVAVEAVRRVEEKKARERKQPNIYRDYYGFSEKPFDLTPDPKYFYLSPKHKEVLAHLVFGLQENNGFLKIVGEVGTGKTMICRSFVRELDFNFNVAYIFNPCLTELELLQTINAELGLPCESGSRKELIDTLNEFLLKERKLGHRVVVIIDEAQDLQPSVLEQLRLLSNLETETEKLIQIVLIGQPELSRLLNQENLRQLRQRITIQWELLPLNKDETRGYIQHRLNVALGKGKVKVTQGAIDWIFRYSKGIPRMINVLADRALLIAYTMNTKRIDPKIVREAARDIGGLTAEPSWKEVWWKTLAPVGVAAGLLLVALNWFVMTDLNPKPRAEQDKKELVKSVLPAPAEPVKLVSEEPHSAASVHPIQAKAPAVPASSAPVPAVAENTRTTVAAEGPLVLTEQDKLVTYLSSLSLTESKTEAVQWILQAWGNDPSSLDGELMLENLDVDYDLIPYELNANLKRLATFNYPAILEITLPNAQGTKYISLISLQGDRGVFGSVDKMVMPLSIIDPLWSRKAIVLWRDFEYLPEKLESGYSGKEAIWLQKNLRLLGFFKGLEAPHYGLQTEEAVKNFQRRYEIKDDGKFHTESKLLLYNLLNIYPTPQLLKP